MKVLLKKMGRLLFVCVFIVCSIGQIEEGTDVSGAKRNETFEFEPIIRQILDGYQSFYRLENFETSTFEFEVDGVPYLGIDVSVDMTLTCHPKELPYFKGMEMAMENGGLGITDRLEARRQMEKRAEEIIEECYLVTDRSTFKYAIKKEDLNPKELSKLSAYYCRVDASAPILYRADSTNTPEDKKMEMFNSGYNMVLQKIKTADVIRANVNYDRLVARNWAQNNAFFAKTTKQTGMILELEKDQIKIEKAIYLLSFYEEDKKELDRMGLSPEDYPSGQYFERLGETMILKVSSSAQITIFDTSQKYMQVENEREYTFKNYADFLKATETDEELFLRPYVFTIKNGTVIKMKERLLI